MRNKPLRRFLGALAPLVLLAGCASAPKHTLGVHKFEFSQTAYSKDEWGKTDYGAQIRDQLESKLARKSGFTVVTRSAATEHQTQDEIIRSRNQDDVFDSKDNPKRLQQGMVADTIVTGSCKRFVEEKTASVWHWYEIPIFFVAWIWTSMEDGEKYTAENIQCSYSVVDVESKKVELSNSLSRNHEGVKGLGKSLDSITDKIADEIHSYFN